MRTWGMLLVAIAAACGSAPAASEPTASEPAPRRPRLEAPRAPPQWSDPRCEGEIDPQGAQNALRRAYPIVRRCYERGRERNPSLSGRVSVDVHVDAAGEVAGLRLRTRFRDREVLDCIRRAVTHVHFPPPSPSGECTVVSAPFALTPAD